MLDLLISPLSWVWLVLLCTGSKAWRLKQKTQSVMLLGAALLLSIAAGTPLPALLLAALEQRHVHESFADLPRGDAILLLGGGQVPSLLEINGLHTTHAADRFLTALELLRRGVSTNLVIGGGS